MFPSCVQIWHLAYVNYPNFNDGYLTFAWNLSYVFLSANLQRWRCIMTSNPGQSCWIKKRVYKIFFYSAMVVIVVGCKGGTRRRVRQR